MIRHIAASTQHYGIKPATGELSVNVLARSTINTQTASGGSHSLAFSTAQGSTQNSQGSPWLSLHSLNSIRAKVNFNGKTAQASTHLNDEIRIAAAG